MGFFKNVKSYLPALLSLAIGVGITCYSAPTIIDNLGIEKDIFDFDKDKDDDKEKSTKSNEEKNQEKKSQEEVEEKVADALDNLDSVQETLDDINADLNVYYKEYIDLIAGKIKEVRENRDIVGDFALYRTMLAKGYFSYGAFEYSTPVVEFTSIRGANVAIGEGVCLNEAHNMVDVFNSLGYEAKVVVGKYYLKGEKKPESANHAVVYVSDGEFAYVLDPTNDTIFLRHAHLLYYSIESQEDTINCFEPVIYYSTNRYGEYEATEILGDFFNDHKKHWDVLKAYKNYKAEAEAYLDEFKEFEAEELLEYEELFNDVYGLVADYFVDSDGNIKDDVKRLSY